MDANASARARARLNCEKIIYQSVLYKSGVALATGDMLCNIQLLATTVLCAVAEAVDAILPQINLLFIWPLENSGFKL